MKHLKKFNEKFENQDYNIDRTEAKKALDDGFCIVYGEKYRDLFERTGEQLINLGIKNGKTWVDDLKLRKGRISMYFEMGKEGKFEEQKLTDILNGLKEFFTENEIEKIKSTDYMSEAYAGNYIKNIGKLQKEIIDSIDENDITLKEATPFYYFKKFKRSSKKTFQVLPYTVKVD
jgi:hypothetical protein